MRISPQLIRQKSKVSSLQSIEYLDLSHLDLSIIEKLSSCKKIQSLDLSYNGIENISTNIEILSQLWFLNISNNKLRCLEGLRKFLAIGTLNLAHNRLIWSELSKIRHLHILDLRLHGNPELERDPYYRIHVIDCLPNVWMLDGRLVTSAERTQVKTFFDDSAVSERPIRHKLLTGKGMTPSHLQNRQINGIFGQKTSTLMTQFPLKETINIDLDIRRLSYFANNVVSDMILEHNTKYSTYTLLEENVSFLQEILGVRKQDLQRGNMLLVLILTSLEFSIPTSLIKETLAITRLDQIGSLSTIDLFLLPKQKRAIITAILLSAVRIERVETKTGGIYDKLYLCINYLVAEAIKSCSGPASNVSGVYKKCKSLLAAEVVLLMCYVPTFSEYMLKEPGVMSLVSSATNDTQVIGNVMSLKDQLMLQEIPLTGQVEAIGEFVQSSVLNNLASSGAKHIIQQKKEERVLNKKHLPKRPMSGPIFSSAYHTKGLTSPNRNPPRILSAKPIASRTPDIGDTVLTAPQSLGRIISLPQPDIALILLELIPVNGAMRSKIKSFEEHYAYIDVKEILWDSAKSFWRPRGTVGDRLTVHYVTTSDLFGSIDHEHAGRTSPVLVQVPTSPKSPRRKQLTDQRETEVFSVMSRYSEPDEDQIIHQSEHSQHPKHSKIPGKRDDVSMQDIQTFSGHVSRPSSTARLSSTQFPESETSQQAAVPTLSVQNIPEPDSSIERVGSQFTISESRVEVSAPQILVDYSHLGLSDMSAHVRLSDPAVDYTESSELLATPPQAAPPQAAPPQAAPPQAAPPQAAPPQAEAEVEDRTETEEVSVSNMNNNNTNIQPTMNDPLTQLSARDSTPVQDAVDIVDQENTIPNDFSDIPSDDDIGFSLVDEEQYSGYTEHELELDLTKDITQRNPAPMNTPDWRSESHSEDRLGSRTPSARVNNLNKMLATNRESPRTPQPQSTNRNSSRQWRAGSAVKMVKSEYVDDVYTPYLRQRTEAWNQTIEDSPDGLPWTPPFGCQISGPETPGVAVRWANTWMAGGKDLYHEEKKGRPRSSHVPGWKEGLQGSTPLKLATYRRGVSASASYYRPGTSYREEMVTKFYPQNTASAGVTRRLGDIRALPLRTAIYVPPSSPRQHNY